MKKYIKAVEDELKKANNGRLTGNIEFKFNLKEGTIANMNCGLGKSFRFSQ